MDYEHAKALVVRSIHAGFVGGLIAAIIYGIGCVQFFAYCRNSRDSRMFRMLIIFLWVLDTVHMALIGHAEYHYLDLFLNDPRSLAKPVWSILVQQYLIIISDTLVRSIFGRRVWLLTGRNYIIAGCIAVSAALVLGSGSAFVTRLSTIDYTDMKKFSYLMYIALAGGIASDVLISGSLCITLAKHRTGFRKTDSIIDTIMIYTINSSLLTTLWLVACFVAYNAWPSTFVFLAIFFSLSKLYFNSLLAALNSRDALWDNCSGEPAMVRNDGGILCTGSSRAGNMSIVVNIERSVVVEESGDKQAVFESSV